MTLKQKRLGLGLASDDWEGASMDGIDGRKMPPGYARKERKSYEIPDDTGDDAQKQFEQDFDSVRDEDGVVERRDYENLRKKWYGHSAGQEFDDWWADNFEKDGQDWRPRDGGSLDWGDYSDKGYDPRKGIR